MLAYESAFWGFLRAWFPYPLHNNNNIWVTSTRDICTCVHLSAPIPISLFTTMLFVYYENPSGAIFQKWLQRGISTRVWRVVNLIINPHYKWCVLPE